MQRSLHFQQIALALVMPVHLVGPDTPSVLPTAPPLV